jgi:hypothetical protein
MHCINGRALQQLGSRQLLFNQQILKMPEGVEGTCVLDWYICRYTNTTACISRISYIDGDKGILRYRCVCWLTASGFVASGAILSAQSCCTHSCGAQQRRRFSLRPGNSIASVGPTPWTGLIVV